MGYLCRRLCKALLLFIISIFVMFACDHRQELYNSDNEVQKRHTAETDFKKLIISAIVSGDYKKVEEYLKQGVDANTTDENSKTLLIIAVESRRYAIVELLVDYGASPLMKDVEGKNSFDYVAGDAVMKALLNNEEISRDELNIILVKDAIKTRKVELVEWVLGKGADPNVLVGGLTPLVAVCMQKTDEELILFSMAKLLVDHPQIDINIKVRGKTALDLARQNNYQSIVQLLEGSRFFFLITVHYQDNALL